MPKIGVMDYIYNAPGVRDEMHLEINRALGLNDETLKYGSNTIDAIFLTFISLLTLAAQQGNYVVPKYYKKNDTISIETIKPPDIFKDLKVGKRRTGKRLQERLDGIPITVNFVTDITRYNIHNTFICPVSSLSKTPISHLGNIQSMGSSIMGFLTGLVTTWGESWKNPAAHSGFIIFEITGSLDHIVVNYTTHGLLDAGEGIGPFSTLFPHDKGEINDHDHVIQKALIRCIETGEVGKNIYLHDVSKILAPVGNKLKGTQLESLIYYSGYVNGIESIKTNPFYKEILDHFVSNNNKELNRCENNQVSYSLTITSLREIPLCPKIVNCMYFVSLVVGSSTTFISGMTRSRIKALQSKINSDRTANVEKGHYADEVFGLDYQELFGLTEKAGEDSIEEISPSQDQKKNWKDDYPSPEKITVLNADTKRKLLDFTKYMGKIVLGIGVPLATRYAIHGTIGMSKRKNKKGKKKNPKTGKKKNPKTGKKKKGTKKNPKTGRKKRV